MDSLTSDPLRKSQLDNAPSVCTQEIVTETAHLEGRLPESAEYTDIVLYTTDGGVETELPAHIGVLSKHSPVLSEIITACQYVRVRMVGDSLSEVKTMLTLMYQPATATATMTSRQLLDALVMTHKYDMKQAMSDVEARLIANVRHVANSNFTDHDTADNIISYAAAGDKFKLRQLRAHSEAYIAVNLEYLGERDLPLTRCSLIRIGIALAQLFKSARTSINDLVTAAESSTERLCEYEAVIKQALSAQTEPPNCPSMRCNGALYLCKVSKRRKEVRCTGNSCSWAVDYQPIIRRPRYCIIEPKAFFDDLLKILST
ncbi:hypothetical protein ABBQ38_000959 [Trebouxia sp. C0009 RCD-2024]